jgi:hypothetical protein
MATAKKRATAKKMAGATTATTARSTEWRFVVGTKAVWFRKWQKDVGEGAPWEVTVCPKGGAGWLTVNVVLADGLPSMELARRIARAATAFMKGIGCQL